MRPVQTMVRRVLSTAAGAVTALLTLSTALAADPPDEPAGRGRAVPRDDRAGHITAFGAANVAVPGGDLGNTLTFGQMASAGGGLELGLGLGVSRYSTIELSGQFLKLGASTDCPACQSEMFAGRAALTFHAAQALGFDPWVRFGAGFRRLNLSGAAPVRLTPALGAYNGIDVASVTLGGDFFPLPWLGLGLFFTGDVGVQLAAPTIEARGAVYGLFQAGLRIALDPQRRPVLSAASPALYRTGVVDRSDFHPPLYNRAAR